MKRGLKDVNGPANGELGSRCKCNPDEEGTERYGRAPSRVHLPVARAIPMKRGLKVWAYRADDEVLH